MPAETEAERFERVDRHLDPILLFTAMQGLATLRAQDPGFEITEVSFPSLFEGDDDAEAPVISDWGRMFTTWVLAKALVTTGTTTRIPYPIASYEFPWSVPRETTAPSFIGVPGAVGRN